MGALRNAVEKKVRCYYDFREGKKDLSREEFEEIKNSTDFTNKDEVLKAVKRRGTMIRYASEELKSDFDVLCAASMVDPGDALLGNQKELTKNIGSIIWHNPRAVELVPVLLNKAYLKPSADEVLDYLRRVNYKYEELLRNIDSDDEIIVMAAMSAAREKFIAKYIEELEDEGVSLEKGIPEEIAQKMEEMFEETFKASTEVHTRKKDSKQEADKNV